MFSVTFGYWSFVFPKSFVIKQPNSYLSDFLSHGPALFLYSLLAKNYNFIFNFEYVVYPILLGYFYLFFIWYPWYKITGDTIYAVMEHNWIRRIYIIFTLNFFSLVGHLIYINNF